MALRFRRQRDGLRELLEVDAGAVGEFLDGVDGGAPADEPELERLLEELFERAPTSDIEALRTRGLDGARFFEEEVHPNWDGRSRGERSAKVASFMRFANVVGADDAAGMGPLVRTKVVVLAWAYDRTYGESLLREIQRKPGRFGKLELSAAD